MPPPPPPATPRYRFPSSPDDIPQPRSGPPKLTNTTTTNTNTDDNVGIIQTSPVPPAKPQFTTPAALNINTTANTTHHTQKKQQQQQQPSYLQTPINTKSKTKPAVRGFSPDPEFFTPLPKRPVHYGGGSNTTSTKTKRRRRSFDLDEIDEALVSTKPKVLGPSSGGWKYPPSYPNEFFGGTQTIGKSTQVPAANVQATPTPTARHQQPLFLQSSVILSSSPPENLNLSFGDTQEDVQDDSGEGESKKEQRVPRRKKRKAVGVFDDIESIASSLPNREDLGDDVDDYNDDKNEKKEKEGISLDDDEDEEGDALRVQDGKVPRSKNKENNPPSRTLKENPLTPTKLRGISNFTGDIPGPAFSTTRVPTTVVGGKQWITVPNQPQLNLPQQKPPSAKLNKAICAMAWSPSHRKRRNANNKYLTGGLAATVLGWAYDAQDSVLRNNTILEQTPHLHRGVKVVEVRQIWREENYVAVVGGVEVQKFEFEGDSPDPAPASGIGSGKDDDKNWRVILIGDENSALRRDLGQGSRVEVRPPTWETTTIDGEVWVVAINWSVKAKEELGG
ncbi:hypothetical protein AA313_de0203624 [Arthrobotrys entomopaga]|nr:hypothetical protein AA313_de0203624 [Arthrobotrys entomopaga]